MFGPSKEEYETVVKANNELRARMEKLRIENALLKSQVRALTTLSPDLASLYVFIQPRGKTTVAELLNDSRFAGMGEEKLKAKLEELVSSGLIDKIEQDWMVHYCVKTPDIIEDAPPKKISK